MRELPLTPATENDRFKSSRTSTMSQFRLQGTAPGRYDGSGDFDDWFQQLLSCVNSADPLYMCIDTYYLEYAQQPAQRDQVVEFHDAGATKRGCHESAQEGRLLVLIEHPCAGANDHRSGLHGDEGKFDENWFMQPLAKWGCDI